MFFQDMDSGRWPFCIALRVNMGNQESTERPDFLFRMKLNQANKNHYSVKSQC